MSCNPILPFITITTKFLLKDCIKRVFDTEMNGYHCFNFAENLSYEMYRPKATKNCQIFTLIYHDVSGEVQKFSGEVQEDLRGGAHLPTLPLKIQPWLELAGRNYNLRTTFLHSRKKNTICKSKTY